jgi:hypothetical protein
MSKAQGIANSANQGQFKNRLINSDMRIDQRNAGASVTTSSGSLVYTLDRWRATYTQTSKYTIQQNAGSVTPPAGFTNYLGVTSSSAYSVVAADFFFINQRIEGFNTADLGWGTADASPVTLSFWVRSSLTGTFGGSLRNSANNRSYSYSYTISSANTWEYKTITVAGDTTGTWIGATNGIGIDLSFNLGTGSTGSTTANAWAAGAFYAPTGATSVVGTSGATFYITGVQLEKGSTATSWDTRSYGTELALCQRYYEKLSLTTLALVESGGSLVTAPLKYYEKRTNPTITYISGGHFQDGTAGVNVSSLTTTRGIYSTYATAQFSLVSALSAFRPANTGDNNGAFLLSIAAEL